jgi:hypothetical protein
MSRQRRSGFGDARYSERNHLRVEMNAVDPLRCAIPMRTAFTVDVLGTRRPHRMVADAVRNLVRVRDGRVKPGHDGTERIGHDGTARIGRDGIARIGHDGAGTRQGMR